MKKSKHRIQKSTQSKRESILGDLEAIRTLLDEPLSNPSEHNTLNIYQTEPEKQPESTSPALTHIDLPILQNIVDSSIEALSAKTPPLEEMPENATELTVPSDTVSPPPSQQTLFKKPIDSKNNNIQTLKGRTFESSAEKKRNLRAKANLLVQDIVDEYVPVIEDALRKQLQSDMDSYLDTLYQEQS
ncbi:MAG: hypothetical protein JKY24_02745 [Pseudomonadales bacterium]|nr:hypothetical protein [Pseudomonadales bacterium]